MSLTDLSFGGMGSGGSLTDFYLELQRKSVSDKIKISVSDKPCIPDLDQIGTRSGMSVGPRTGSDLDPIWIRLDPELDPIGTRSGPGWDQIWV